MNAAYLAFFFLDHRQTAHLHLKINDIFKARNKKQSLKLFRQYNKLVLSSCATVGWVSTNVICYFITGCFIGRLGHFD